MKRRRISRVGMAGILALVSAFGLVAILSLSNGALKNINPTEQQEMVDAIVRTRLTQTAEMRATPQATVETTLPADVAIDHIDPSLRTATELVREATATDVHPGTVTPD